METGIPDLRMGHSRATIRKTMNATKAAIAGEVDQGFEAQDAHVGLIEWFKACDGILDLHRRDFVFQEAAAKARALHKAKLSWFIRLSRAMSVPISDPEFGDSDLADRLQIRIRQLELAYDLVDDSKLSEDEAEKLLQEVFPE